jgi:hypothetical protein
MSPHTEVAHRWAAIVLCLSTIALLAGCSAAAEDTATRNKASCERAFAETVGTVGAGGLDTTVRRCVQWSDWIVIAQAYPDALGGLSPLEMLEARCADPDASLARYTTCVSLKQSTETPRPTPRVTVPPIRTPAPTPRPRRERIGRTTRRSGQAENRSRNTRSSRDCTPGYQPCLPRRQDYNCYGSRSGGPFTEPGVVYRVTGGDPYRLDADNDGRGCESQR